jgi:hypothetical protein
VAVPWARPLLLLANTAEVLPDAVTAGSGMCCKAEARVRNNNSRFGEDDPAHDVGVGRGPVVELGGVGEGVERMVEVGLEVGGDDVGEAVVVVEHGLDGEVLWLVEELCEGGKGSVHGGGGHGAGPAGGSRIEDVMLAGRINEEKGREKGD